MAGFGEHSSETSGSIKAGNFFTNWAVIVFSAG
jgi:hypothetical protein